MASNTIGNLIPNQKYWKALERWAQTSATAKHCDRWSRSPSPWSNHAPQGSLGQISAELVLNILISSFNKWQQKHNLLREGNKLASICADRGVQAPAYLLKAVLLKHSAPDELVWECLHRHQLKNSVIPTEIYLAGISLFRIVWLPLAKVKGNELFLFLD